MRAKLVNEAIGFERYRNPKEALFDFPPKFEKLQKAFEKLRVGVDKLNYSGGRDLDDVGEKVGNFLGKFYNYEPPLDPEDENMLHPMIIELIDNWLQKNKKKYEKSYEQDEQNFWDGVACSCSQPPY